MGVRFVIGRAGTGKTHHCIESIRQRLLVEPKDGPTLILLVPEQAALQMERAILAPGGPRAAHRVEVLSFTRLAVRVLDEAPRLARKAISETARAMLLGSILDRLGPSLRYYRRQRRQPGLISQLVTTITELIQEAVAPEVLKSTMDAGGVPVEQASKWQDVADIYAAYLHRLGDERADTAQLLEIARAQMAECRLLRMAEIFVDGFASFTQQELHTLVKLAQLSNHMDITLLADPNRLGRGVHEATGIFRKTVQSYRRVASSMRANGMAIEEPLNLSPQPPHRFYPSPELSRLESRLSASAGDHETVESSTAATGADPSRRQVSIACLPDRRLEVAYAVSCVRRWVREVDGLRYRDTAIIARDLNAYADLLVEALENADVPYFLDRRRRVAHHPLTDFVRTAVQLATEDFAAESVIAILKTGLLPLLPSAADLLENEILSRGIHGWSTYQQPWQARPRRGLSDKKQPPGTRRDRDVAGTQARLDSARRVLVDTFGAWRRFATMRTSHTGTEWSRALAELLERADVWMRMHEWAIDAELGGKLTAAAMHTQMAEAVAGLLEELGDVLGGDNLDAAELQQVIEGGLAVKTLGLAPPMVDQVLVGSVERSRHPNLRAAVIVGLNDGVFPHPPVEDVVLNDDDRALLAYRNIEIQPPSRDRVHDESLLFYVAMTRSSERLVVTYAQTDQMGKPLKRSPMLPSLVAALPGTGEIVIGDPDRSRAEWDVYSRRDLGGRLASEFRRRMRDHVGDPWVEAYWNTVYELLWCTTPMDEFDSLAVGGLATPKVAAISPEAVERIHGGTARMSVSQLESYAACPFKHFAKYVLRLQERPRADLEPIDVGDLHHAILDRYVDELLRQEGDFARLDEGQLFETLQRTCDRLGRELHPGAVGSTARDGYIARRAAGQLARFVRHHRKIAAGGRFRPKGTEIAFGMDGKGLPALSITTPAGRQVLLRGFIDRVDVAELGDELLGVVIDYKSAANYRLNLSKVYHGVSLQLPAYLLVLAHHGASLAGRPIIPAAALYYGLTLTRTSVDHPSDEPADRIVPGTARPRGFVRWEHMQALEPVDAPGWSQRYRVRTKVDGTPGDINKSDAALSADFDNVLGYTQWKMGRLADALLDGKVAVRPYRLGGFSPCSWCEMADVCGYEMGRCDTRFLPSHRRTEVFRRVGQPKE